MTSRLICIFATILALASCGAGEGMTLRVGLMPAVDAIPLVVAEAEGYFEAEGIEVEMELFRDQLIREAALQSGDLDAALSDLVNVIAIRDGSLAVIAGTQGHFSLLGAPNSPIRSLDDWRDEVPVALVETSIVNYLAGEMLAAASIGRESIDLVPILQIPLRMELLLDDKVESAVLPEPLSRIAVLQGARELADTASLPSTP